MEKDIILPKLYPGSKKAMKKVVPLPRITAEQRQAIISDHYRQGGLKGGATMKMRGRAYFEEIGRKGALTRWNKKKENESI